MKHFGTVLILLAIAGLLAWKFWPTTPESQVLKQVALLGSTLSKEEGESNATMAAKMLRFESLFASPCELNVQPVVGTEEPEQLSSMAVRMRGMYTEIQLTLDSAHTTFLKGGTEAEVKLQATLWTRTPGGESGKELRTILVVLRQIDGDWKIVRIDQIGDAS